MRQCRHGFAAPRVLVVEDEGLIASIAAELLADEGYDVRTAGDGGSALELVLDWMPCLILLDILMPVMDGRAFLHRLWQLEERDQTPVVLVSGAGGPTSASSACASPTSSGSPTGSSDSSPRSNG